MSVYLNPSSALGFQRPLTQLVKRPLTITNNNSEPVAFKVKTTAPKLYCIRPNSGRLEPGETIEVSFMLQAMREEPPLNAKCKDKFLIQSTIIFPDTQILSLQDIWAEANKEGKVHQQKLRAVYLLADDQMLEEEDESVSQVNTGSVLHAPDDNAEQDTYKIPELDVTELIEENGSLGNHSETRMSVSLNPSTALGFRRPLTQLIKHPLTITNNNSKPIAFKVKTTAPKLYCAQPNSGRIEPGEIVEVYIILQAMQEDPPLNAKCKDKFLIQSTIILLDMETLSLQDIWVKANKEGKVHQQKLRAVYLPEEGQMLEEEDESISQVNASVLHAPNDDAEDWFLAQDASKVPELDMTKWNEENGSLGSHSETSENFPTGQPEFSICEYELFGPPGACMIEDTTIVSSTRREQVPTQKGLIPEMEFSEGVGVRYNTKTNETPMIEKKIEWDPECASATPARQTYVVNNALLDQPESVTSLDGKKEWKKFFCCC